jgi:hypothetical protein
MRIEKRIFKRRNVINSVGFLNIRKNYGAKARNRCVIGAMEFNKRRITSEFMMID